MIGQTISHYKIFEKLGGGGMGVVYKAEDTKLKRLVALKFLPPDLTREDEAKERFIHEAQTASALDHPNICAIHEIGETEDGQLFIVMAYYGGETLKKKVDSGQLPVDSAIDYAIQIAQGLAKAHEHGITHRDIKPANVMITNDGVAKIVDFGLAKLTGQTKLTKAGATLGTVAYMSPEQARGEEVDHRADIWALGVVLYEMLTGQVPFKGDYELAVIYLILNENPQPLTKWRSDIPAGLEEIANKCLQKDINNRYQAAAGLTNDLRDVQSRRIDPTRPTQHLPRPANAVRMLRQHPWTAGLAAAVLLVITLVSAYLTLNKTRPSEISLQAMPSIAVMYFEDATGDEQTKWLARGLPHMLITSLEQCSDVRVIGYQRLYDVLKEIGKENLERIDKTTATEIARKAKAKTMLLGSIFKWGNVIRVDYQLQDVAKGDLLVAAKVTGENPLTLADDLASHIRNNLGSSLSSSSAPKVAEVTTHSLEAYRYYLQGKGFEGKGIWKEAWESYAKAINLDSTFAIAYLDMWDFGFQARRPQAELDSMLAKALRYAPRTSERERLYILAREAAYRGKIRDFSRIGEELLKKYPTFGEFYAEMASYYVNRREFKKALPYARKWVELCDYSVHAWDFLEFVFEKLNEADSAQYCFEKRQKLHPDETLNAAAFHYLRHEKIDQAFSAARRAVAAYPEEPWSHRVLGYAYFFAGQVDSAEIEFHQVGLKGWASAETELIALTRLYQGRRASATELLQEKKRSKDSYVSKGAYSLELSLYDLQRENDKARVSWVNAKPHLYSTWAVAQTRGGDTFFVDSLLALAIPEAYYLNRTNEALRLCDLLTQEISQNDLGGGYAFQCSVWRADIFYAAGRFDEASNEYQAVLRQERKTIHRYRLADCYYRLKKYEHAKALLAQIGKTDEPEIWWLGISYAHAYPRTFYLLGQVNEALGDAAAVKAYQQFLEIWKEADQDLPELVDAKARLAKLQ